MEKIAFEHSNSPFRLEPACFDSFYALLTFKFRLEHTDKLSSILLRIGLHQIIGFSYFIFVLNLKVLKVIDTTNRRGFYSYWLVQRTV